MEIKVTKERKVEDYTFINDGLNLGKPERKNESDGKKGKAERDFRLADNTRADRLKKSRITGGHNKQGHSAVYE